MTTGKSLDAKRKEAEELRQAIVDVEAKHLDDQQKAQDSLDHSLIDEELARLRGVLASAKSSPVATKAVATTTKKQED